MLRHQPELDMLHRLLEQAMVRLKTWRQGREESPCMLASQEGRRQIWLDLNAWPHLCLEEQLGGTRCMTT